MTAVVLRVELTEQPIELSEYEALVAHESAGAVGEELVLPYR